MSTVNPFIFGDPVQGEAFLNRKRELNRLVSRIRQGGSAIITAEPRMGKTSLLLHLQATASTLFGEEYDRLLFHYVDAQGIAGAVEVTSTQFWRIVFRPLAQCCESARKAYKQENFETTAWEPIFAQLENAGVRFVLLLDEFGDLLNLFREPTHAQAVFSMLRSLASRFTSFSLIIATRHTVTDLDSETKPLTNGSPYFNFAQVIVPQPFPKKDMGVLLARAKERFTAADRAFIQRVAGQHPYFLQTAAYYLWEHHKETFNVQRRYEEAGKEFLTETESVLKDIWDSWDSHKQMAFTLVALDNMPLLLSHRTSLTNVSRLLPSRTFNIQGLLRDLPDLSPELRKLEHRGFVRPDNSLQSGYRPHAEVMLWFLAEELIRVLREEQTLKAWLAAQQWKGLLTQKEEEALKKAFKSALPLLREGAQAFIRAAAEGAARGVFQP